LKWDCKQGIVHTGGKMPELTVYDLIIMAIIGGIFVVGLWTTIFIFLFGFMKRLDSIILLLERDEK
jgi:hypothetical protein